MRVLVVAAVAAIGSAACSTTSSTPQSAHILASWALKDIATDTVTGCPTGFDTALVYAQAADAAGNPIGTCVTPSSTCFIDAFPCSDGAGTSELLPASNYLAWVAITNAASGDLYATSVTGLVDIGTIDKPFSTYILNDGGYFHLSWQLVGVMTMNPLTCYEAKASGSVQTTATVTGTTTSFTDKYNCLTGQAFSEGLPSADYTVAVSVTNTANMLLGAPVTVAVTLGRQNDIEDLGVVQLPINAQ